MAGFSRIPILADRIAGYRQAIRTGAMAPDWRLGYGLSMFSLGVAMLLFAFAAMQHPPVGVHWMREWHIPVRAILIGALAFSYSGAYVVSLALDPRSVARRSREHHKHHKQVT